MCFSNSNHWNFGGEKFTYRRQWTEDFLWINKVIFDCIRPIEPFKNQIFFLLCFCVFCMMLRCRVDSLWASFIAKLSQSCDPKHCVYFVLVLYCIFDFCIELWQFPCARYTRFGIIIIVTRPKKRKMKQKSKTKFVYHVLTRMVCFNGLQNRGINSVEKRESERSNKIQMVYKMNWC